MKRLNAIAVVSFIGAAAFGTSVRNEWTLHCASKSTSPYYQFDVKFSNFNTKASIQALKLPNPFVDVDLRPQPLEGCQDIEGDRQVKVSAKAIYVECDGDGDAGHLNLKAKGAARVYEGKMYFPEGNEQLELHLNKDVAVTCQQKN